MPPLTDGDQQWPDPNRHKLTKSYLQIAPFVRLQQEIERSHLIVVDPLFEDTRIGLERQLAIGRITEIVAGKDEPRIGTVDTGKVGR